MSDDQLPDFDGKIVTFYCVNSPPEFATALLSPSFEQQAGRLFVVGEIASHIPSQKWDNGLRSAIAWDQVNSYVVFDSHDDFQSRVTMYYRQEQSNSDA